MIITGKVTSEMHLKGEVGTGHYGSTGYGAQGCGCLQATRKCVVF